MAERYSSRNIFCALLYDWTHTPKKLRNPTMRPIKQIFFIFQGRLSSELIINNIIIPMINAAHNKKFLIYVLTNNFEDIYVVKNRQGNIQNTHPEILRAVHDGKVILRYHSKMTDYTFSQELRAQGIKNLIYIGFASNMCIPFRPSGMFNMRKHGFQPFYVPKASSSVEFGDSWYTYAQHEAMTVMFGLNHIPSLDADELLSALEYR